MTVLPVLDPDTAPASAAEQLRAVQAAFGAIPNLARVMANSPALLRGYLDLSAALNNGIFDTRTREQIALAIAEQNGCAYCLSAHTYFAGHAAKLSPEDIHAARRGTSSDPRIRAILTFATAVNEGRGDISGAELAAARVGGLTDEELAEIVGHVAVNVLTNYFAKAADVPIDFPLVTPADAA